jgi:hypothetical protein
MAQNLPLVRGRVLEACSLARANGSTFNLKCFAGATTCDAVAVCMKG